MGEPRAKRQRAALRDAVAKPVRWRERRKWFAGVVEKQSQGGTGATKVTEKDLVARLGATETVQDSDTNLLYMLLRKRGARDFSYDVGLRNPVAVKKELSTCIENWDSTPVLLGQAIAPEKQHIVPFCLFKDSSERRVSRHPAHNIGNITFISRALNGASGLGETPMALADDDAQNLNAHFLGGAVTPWLRKCLKLAADRRPVGKAFQELVRARAKAVTEGWLQWIDELEAEAGMDALNVGEAPRRFHVVDRVLAQYHRQPVLLDGHPLCFGHLSHGNSKIVEEGWPHCQPPAWKKAAIQGPSVYCSFGMDDTWGLGLSVNCGWLDGGVLPSLQQRKYEALSAVHECFRRVRDTLEDAGFKETDNVYAPYPYPGRLTQKTSWIVLFLHLDPDESVATLAQRLTEGLRIAASGVNPTLVEVLSSWE